MARISLTPQTFWYRLGSWVPAQTRRHARSSGRRSGSQCAAV